MTTPPDIAATELLSVRVVDTDGSVRLRIRDREGKQLTVSLPAHWLDAIVTALPWPAASTEARPLASWSMDRVGGEDLLLTLRTAEGQAVTFAMKPWHVAGMATIANYGNADPAPKGSIH
jgi:hypothetical protein